MPFITAGELANRFRTNAADCERTATSQLRQIARDRLLKTAQHYRQLAENLERGPQQL